MEGSALKSALRLSLWPHKTCARRRGVKSVAKVMYEIGMGLEVAFTSPYYIQYFAHPLY